MLWTVLITGLLATWTLLLTISNERQRRMNELEIKAHLEARNSKPGH